MFRELIDLKLVVRDVEAVEYFLLSLPAPYKVSCFRVCFRIPATCFIKNASAFGSSKSQMLTRLLPASFFKVLPLLQKFNRLRIPAYCLA